jgi:hypothetical protein
LAKISFSVKERETIGGLKNKLVGYGSAAKHSYQKPVFGLQQKEQRGFLKEYSVFVSDKVASEIIHFQQHYCEQAFLFKQVPFS